MTGLSGSPNNVPVEPPPAPVAATEAEPVVAEAAAIVEWIGDAGWPANPGGEVVNVLLIEDQAAVALAREIVAAPGVSVVIPGPGDLRRAYNRDMEAVENAIQSVLAACKEFDVPCGITAGVEAFRLGEHDGVIAFGGGSGLDLGKMVAFMSGQTRPVWDFEDIGDDEKKS